ncbi:MAG: bidirectional hydrogenase complex protein HoxU [Acidimicrobiales bacterium]
MSEDVRTLVIDGKDVAGSPGQSILSVARENGVEIPALCHLEGLTPVGSCRLCMVEVEGTSRLVPSCATAVEEGMKVTTKSERLLAYRRQVIELFFMERNHVCSVCVADNHCELQELARSLGVTHFDLPPLHPVADVDATHERFVVDHNRCVLCTRCVRVCDEIEGAHTWDVRGRGTNARLVADLGVPWGQSTTCTSCGKCVQVCPTGALYEKGRSVAEAKSRRPYVPFLVARGLS